MLHPARNNGDNKLVSVKYAEQLKIMKMKNIRLTKFTLAMMILLVVQFSNALAQPAIEIEKLTKAIAVTPNDEKLYLERGSLYFRYGKFVEAKTDADKVLAINPKNINALILRGNSKSAAKDFDGAIADFSQIITALPSRAFRAYIGRGEAYLKKYELPNALNDFNKALEIDPKLVNAYYGRAKVYEIQEEFNKAVGEYTLALQNTPPAQVEELAAGLVSRGKALQSAGKLNEAGADFARVAESNTKSFGEAAFLLGMMLQKIGKNAEAEKLFLRAKEGKYVDDLGVLKNLGDQMQNTVAILKEINSYNDRIAAMDKDIQGFAAKLKALNPDDFATKADITEQIHKNTTASMAMLKEKLSKFPKGILSAELEQSRVSTISVLEGTTNLNRSTRPFRVAELRIRAENDEAIKKENALLAQMTVVAKAKDNAAYEVAKQKWLAQLRISREIFVRGMAKLASFNDSEWSETKKILEERITHYDKLLKEYEEKK